MEGAHGVSCVYYGSGRMFFQLLCSETVVQLSDYFGNLIIVYDQRGPVFFCRKPGPVVIMICWLHAEQEPEADVGGDDGGHGENVTKRPPFIVRRIPWRSCCNTADIDPETHDHGWLRGC